MAQLYGKGLGSGAVKSYRAPGRPKGFPTVVSILLSKLLSWETSSNDMSLQVVFIFQNFLKAFSSVAPSIEQSCELFSITDDCI